MRKIFGSTRREAAGALLTIAIVVVALLLFPLPVRVQFKNLQMELVWRWTLVVSFSLLIFARALVCSRMWAKVVGCLIGLLISIPSVFYPLSQVIKGPKVSWEESLRLVQEVPSKGIYYRLYRASDGQFHSLVLLSERDLIGIKLVRPLYSVYGAEEGRVDVDGNGKVTLIHDGEGKGRLKMVEVPVRG